MPKLVALKRLRYPRGGADGREYGPGDTFEADERDAQALMLIRYARRDMTAASWPAGADGPPRRPNVTDPGPAVAPAVDETDALRAEYEAKTGKRPFMGWKADKLRERIAAAPAKPGNYSRRDMRAED